MHNVSNQLYLNTSTQNQMCFAMNKLKAALTLTRHVNL